MLIPAGIYHDQHCGSQGVSDADESYQVRSSPDAKASQANLPVLQNWPCMLVLRNKRFLQVVINAYNWHTELQGSRTFSSQNKVSYAAVSAGFKAAMSATWSLTKPFPTTTFLPGWSLDWLQPFLLRYGVHS